MIARAAEEAGAAVQNILEVVDWSKEEKAKIWEAALDAEGKYHDLTFDDFKALIQGEGGYNLVERMAAGASAAHIERISGPQQQWDPPLAQLNGLLRDPLSQAPSAQQSTALSSEPSRNLTAGAEGSVRFADGPDRTGSGGAGGGAEGADDGSEEDGKSSSDSEDMGVKKKPALLTKRHGESSSTLGRGMSVEGGQLRSPRRSAQLAMLAVAQAGSVDTAAPSELPRKRSASGAVDGESAGLSGGSPGAVPPSPEPSQDRSEGSACTVSVTPQVRGCEAVSPYHQRLEFRRIYSAGGERGSAVDRAAGDVLRAVLFEGPSFQNPVCIFGLLYYVVGFWGDCVDAWWRSFRAWAFV